MMQTQHKNDGILIYQTLLPPIIQNSVCISNGTLMTPYSSSSALLFNYSHIGQLHRALVKSSALCRNLGAILGLTQDKTTDQVVQCTGITNPVWDLKYIDSLCIALKLKPPPLSHQRTSLVVFWHSVYGVNLDNTPSFPLSNQAQFRSGATNETPHCSRWLGSVTTLV